MRNIKRKIENSPSDYLKEISQESNIFLSQHQSKNVLRLLSKFSFFRIPSLPNGIFKCSNKICKVYLIECSEFELENKEKVGK